MARQKVPEQQVLVIAKDLVRDRLPPGWSMRTHQELARGQKQARAKWTIRAPGGDAAEFVVEATRDTIPAKLLSAAEGLRSAPGGAKRPRIPLLVAPFISRRAREMLIEREVSFVDSTGNLRLVSDAPGLFVETTGTERNPFAERRAIRSLRGRGAASAVRALIDFRPPFGVRNLSERADVPIGTLSRTIKFLDGEALVEKDDRGRVTSVDWRGVLERWAQDCEFRTKNATTFLDPRGPGATARNLREATFEYAVTGSIAAQSYEPIAPAPLSEIYVPNVWQASKRLGLRPVETGFNVVLIEPYAEAVFARTSVRDGLVTVAPSQIAIDLLTGPGREPAEGEQLIKWMKANEDAWRA